MHARTHTKCYFQSLFLKNQEIFLRSQQKKSEQRSNKFSDFIFSLLFLSISGKSSELILILFTRLMINVHPIIMKGFTVEKKIKLYLFIFQILKGSGRRPILLSMKNICSRVRKSISFATMNIKLFEY